jgi:hypothetical protein
MIILILYVLNYPDELQNLLMMMGADFSSDDPAVVIMEMNENNQALHTGKTIFSLFFSEL